MAKNSPPISIQANRISKTIQINWSDGHQSNYDFGLLRVACPCATCRGGHENMRLEPDEIVFTKSLPDSPETHIVKVEAVGAYAISIEWENGHNFGIFTWHYLRALCPCAECRK